MVNDKVVNKRTTEEKILQVMEKPRIWDGGAK